MTKSLESRFLGLFAGCLFLVLPISADNQERLQKSFEGDMAYYHRAFKSSSRDAKIEFMEQVIEKFRRMHIEEIYLIPAKDELDRLQVENGEVFQEETEEAVEEEKKEKKKVVQ